MHTNCNCTACQQLDRLPVRLHGIPHARQSTFLALENAPAAPTAPTRANHAQLSPDALPLFAGGLEPCLF